VKLLFDHHLSPTLVQRLADLFPGSAHVWSVALHNVPDTKVWLYAKEHGFTVVSKDADFSEISMELGYPPKLLWLRIKNWSTDQVEELLRADYPLIVDLERSSDRGILVLFRRSSLKQAKPEL
jgi:predicted nuclease of predicted toxin-antitoxin system